MPRLLSLLALPVFLALIFVPAPLAADQFWQLPAGFSFVGSTVQPPDGYDVDALLTAHPALEAVYRFAEDSQSFQFRLVLPGGSRFGETFPLESGRGYALKLKEAAGVTLPGTTDGQSRLELKTGFNLRAIPRLDAPLSSRTLLTRNSRLQSVFAWNSGRSAFDFTLRLAGDSSFGDDVLLPAGQGVFLRVDEATALELGSLAIPTELAPTSLELSLSLTRVLPGATLDLSPLAATVRWPGGAYRTVTPVWSAPAGDGTLEGLLYQAALTEGTTELTALWSDGTASVQSLLTVVRTTAAGETPPVVRLNEFTLTPAVQLVDGERLSVVRVMTDEIVLTASSSTTLPAAGSILIGYEGDGFLRKVTDVQVTDSTVRVVTREARLDEAFENLDYTFQGTLADLEQRTLAPLQNPADPRAAVIQRYFVARLAASARAAGGNLIESSKLGRLLSHTKLSADLTLAEISFDPRLEVDLQIRGFSLQRFLFVVGGEINGRMGLKIAVTGKVELPIHGKVNLYEALPYPFLIGPVPFTFEWGIDLGLDAHADAVGEIDFASSWMIRFRNGAEYTKEAGWLPINEVLSRESSDPQPSLKGVLEVQPWLGLSFSLKLLAVSGPELQFKNYLSFSLELPSLTRLVGTVKAGIEASIAAVVELYSWEMAEYKATLAKFERIIFKKEWDFTPPKPPAVTVAAVGANAFSLTVIPEGNYEVWLRINDYHYRTIHGTASVLVSTPPQSSFRVDPGTDYRVEAFAVRWLGGTRVDSSITRTTVTTLAANDEDPVQFEDPNFERMIRCRINEYNIRNGLPPIIPDDQPLKRGDLGHSWLKYFYVQTLLPEYADLHTKIFSLKGLEQFPSLKRLVLHNSRVSDLSPALVHLELEELDTGNNRVSNVRLQGLPVLANLRMFREKNLSSVHLASLPLLSSATLTAGSGFSLSVMDMNHFSALTLYCRGDISEQNLPSATYLPGLQSLVLTADQDIDTDGQIKIVSPHPHIRSLKLSDYPQLAVVAVGRCRIDEIVLSDLPALTSFVLEKDAALDPPDPLGRLQLVNLPLLDPQSCASVLPQQLGRYPERKVSGEILLDTVPLTYFSCDGHRLDKLELRNMEQLQTLYISGPTLKQVYLSGLPVLQVCGVGETDLSSVRFLSSLDKIKVLTISSNSSLTSLSGLETLTSLQTLYASHNNLTQLDGLTGLTTLTRLEANGNPITSISGLSSLTALSYLNLRDASITSISALSGLTNLSYLDLSNNRISDLSPLVANSGLASGDIVWISGNANLILDDPENEDAKNLQILKDRGVVIY